MAWFVDDGAAELHALLGVRVGLLERRPGDAHGESRDARARLVEGLHDGHESAAGGAEHVLLGDLHVLEEDLGGVRGADAQLVLVAAHAYALVVAADDEAGEAVIGLGEHGVDVGDAAVGDEALLAVEDETVTLVLGGRLDGRDVAAGLGLGQAERGELGVLLVAEPGQPLLLLLLGAGDLDGSGRQVVRARCWSPGRRIPRPSPRTPSRWSAGRGRLRRTPRGCRRW